MGRGASCRRPGMCCGTRTWCKTLRVIEKGGAKAFYRGDRGEGGGGGTAGGSSLSVEDFKSYRPRFLEAVEGDFNGYGSTAARRR